LLTPPQVEETLFRVHAYFFIRDSPYFKELLALGEINGNPATTEEILVRLDNDVNSVDFERFLSILYPLYVITLPLNQTALT
jgi:hypothetical protein